MRYFSRDARVKKPTARFYLERVYMSETAPQAAREVVVLAFCALLFECGSKSGLGVPCEWSVERTRPVVVFVLNHSNVLADAHVEDGRVYEQVMVDTLA